MIKEITLPDLGEGIDSAVISEVPVTKGGRVTKGGVLVVLESDKASMEIPSDYSGEISEVLVKEGDKVSTGDLLFKIETEDKIDTEPKEVVDEKNSLEKPEKEPKPKPEPRKEQNLLRAGDNVFASPGVRRLARELNIDLGLILGSGAKGRITKEDLHGHIRLKMQTGSTQVNPPKRPIDFSQWGDVELQKLTKINKITGKRLQAAWQEIPHVTQCNTADITDLEIFRKELKEEGRQAGTKVTFLPFLMRAVTFVLKEIPRFNSSLDENEENLVVKDYFHIGVAVDTPSGLMVPSVRDVDKKTILDLSKELMDISERARNKKLRPDELKGSSFTISSLGGIGGTGFSPIVNPPEVAILGVSKSEWKPVYNKDNKDFIPRYILPFSLSYDHRVVDGASGAVFVERLSVILGDPELFKE